MRPFRMYNSASDKRRVIQPNSPFFPSPFTSLQMFSSNCFSKNSRHFHYSVDMKRKEQKDETICKTHHTGRSCSICEIAL